MKAVLYDNFASPLCCTRVDDPRCEDEGVIIQVRASGICRSDWHGWQGHDPDIKELPHVPGHELAGVIVETGKKIRKWKGGERVTLPFVCGCGSCPQCKSGNHQICDFQFQPGFTHWGSFAEYVAIKYADTNLVSLPEKIDFVTAASLGCRFGTAYRAVVVQGDVKAGDRIAIHGCGGVGLSAIMIASSLEARVIAIDIDEAILELAKSLGAGHTINAHREDVVASLHDLSGGGVDVSIDALGSAETCSNSILSLRKQGRHVQVGLLAGEEYRPRLPMEAVISRELQIVGSHGLQAHRYSDMLDQIISGKLDPARLVGKTVSLEQAPSELEAMDSDTRTGITVIQLP